MKTLKLKVRVKSSKNEDLPDWGAGPGDWKPLERRDFLKEIEFNDIGLEPHQVALGLNDVFHDMLKEVTEFVIEEVN